MKADRINRLRRKLSDSRARLFKDLGKCADKLFDMTFVAVKDVWRISTNGDCIFFDPDWLQKLGEVETDFVLAHQLMHIEMEHINRPQYYKGDRFHLACDIVANAKLFDMGMRYEKLPFVGKIFTETFYPKVSGSILIAEEALDGVPFDPAVMTDGERRTYMMDSEIYWDKKADRGEEGIIILGPQDTPDFTYRKTPKEEIKIGYKIKDSLLGEFKKIVVEPFEDIVLNEPVPEKHQSEDNMDLEASSQIDSLMHMREKDTENGVTEDFRERIWQKAPVKRLDWKKLLHHFIQEEVCDYSFTPPDRRFSDSDFFLPDFNVYSENPKEVLFMVDTSGSVEEDMLSVVYSEICEALSQFNGNLTGTLGFFDTKVYDPIAFQGVEDLSQIVPKGGGGTDFNCVFEYIKNSMSDNPPCDIVIFTDGQSDFPDESAAQNIPVLWLLSNDTVTCPWGKYAVIKK